MINSNIKIILGSSSPRRQELLKLITENFSVRKSNTKESFESKEPSEIVREISLKKSKDIEIYPNELLITADTIVTLNGKIFGKPKDFEDGLNMLKKLSNKTHNVYTGITLRTNEKIKSFYDLSKVTFYPLDDQIIKFYLEKYQPFDKAGGYAIQDFAAVFVKKIEGDYYNIMGLPVAKLYWELKEMIHNL